MTTFLTPFEGTGAKSYLLIYVHQELSQILEGEEVVHMDDVLIFRANKAEHGKRIWGSVVENQEFGNYLKQGSV